MQIIKDQTVVTDNWQHIAADTAMSNLPNGDIIIPLQLWNENKNELQARTEQLGVRLDSGADLNEISDHLDKFSVIALEFPAFRDGRGYSLARRLREHLGYKGEIRAVGNVLRDQVEYMSRVGINAFEIDSSQEIEDALNAFDDISIKYQASSDEAQPFYRRRAS